MENRIYGKERIGPTACITACYRTFSDIPYSKEIFDILEKLRIINNEPDIPEELKRYERSPLIEARYKMDSLLISESKINQILELASGLSPRGLDITSNKNIKYVEIDLPIILETKKEIINTITKKIVNNNLFLESGDVLKENDLLKACEHFNEKEPLVIINEGLLAYLTLEDKKTLSKNIHKILSIFRGVWITPDIILPDSRGMKNSKITYTQDLEKLTGSTINKNRFENEKEAQIFFENMGFEVERRYFKEVYNNLVSPKKLNIAQEDVDKLIGLSVVFVMRVKN